MTYRQRTVAKILLLVAQMFSDDPKQQREISALSTDIAVNAKREHERDVEVLESALD